MNISPDLSTLSAQLDATIARLESKRGTLVPPAFLLSRIDAALARIATVKKLSESGSPFITALAPGALDAGPVHDCLRLATKGALVELVALESEIDGKSPTIAGLLNGFGMAALGAMFEKVKP